MESELAGSLTQLILYFGGFGVALGILGFLIWMVVRQYQQGVIADNKRLGDENRELRERLKEAQKDVDDYHEKFSRAASRSALLETLMIRAGVEVPSEA